MVERSEEVDAPGSRTGAGDARRADARASRERLLAAAARELGRDRRAPLGRVAATAGVSRSTLYRHFPRREDLERTLSEAPGGAETEPFDPAADAAAADAAVDRQRPRAERGEDPSPGELGREEPLALEAARVLDEVPPHLVAEQVTAEARRIAGVPVALYLVDIDGTHLLRMAGNEQFPARIEAPLALGPELATEAVAELAERLADEVPGCVPVPMWLRGRAIGLLLALRVPRASLAELAHQAAAALELANAYTDVFEAARRRKETNAASEIQQDLLPPRLVRVSGGTLAGSVLPSYDVGGDFFDFADNRDGAWLAIADAEGVGARATATSTIALGAFRSARRRTASLEQAARDIDTAMRELGGVDISLTGLLARWNAALSTLTWLSFDHDPPLLLTAEGGSRPLEGERHSRLGTLEPECSLRPATQRLGAGDRVVLYSDGVVERRKADGEPLGAGELGRILASVESPSAGATVRAVQRAVIDASPQRLSDDAAILVLVVG